MSPRAVRPAALLASLLLAGCARRVDPQLVSQPIAGRSWVSPLHRDHPLAGRIWDARAARFVDEATLAAALGGADYVLLGETHDNVDHHLLQARLVRTVVASGRRPALALEMLDSDQQLAVDAALARSPRDPDALAAEVDWNHSRWPDFAMYRPILAAALEAGLPVVAVNLPRSKVKEIVSKGESALEPTLRARLAREDPLPAEALEELRAEMRESHCNELPEKLIDPLVLAQRARDAQMAARLEQAAEGRGGILIAGKGHVRTDRGVPAVLAKDLPGAKIVAVGFAEVSPERKQPADYVEEFGKGPLPLDYAVFTPAAERDDPCEGLRERERSKKAAAPEAPAPPAPPGTAASRPASPPPTPRSGRGPG